MSGASGDPAAARQFHVVALGHRRQAVREGTGEGTGGNALGELEHAIVRVQHATDLVAVADDLAAAAVQMDQPLALLAVDHGVEDAQAGELAAVVVAELAAVVPIHQRVVHALEPAAGVLGGLRREEREQQACQERLPERRDEDLDQCVPGGRGAHRLEAVPSKEA